MPKAERRIITWRTFREGCIYYRHNHPYRTCAFPMDLRKPAFQRVLCTGPDACVKADCPRWPRMRIVKASYERLASAAVAKELDECYETECEYDNALEEIMDEARGWGKEKP